MIVRLPNEEWTVKNYIFFFFFFGMQISRISSHGSRYISELTNSLNLEQTFTLIRTLTTQPRALPKRFACALMGTVPVSKYISIDFQSGTRISVSKRNQISMDQSRPPQKNTVDGL